MTTAALTVVGTAVARGDGPDKVSGAAKYTADMLLPGMLFGKVLRSPYPHARIVAIDASAAWEVPGVRAVVTGRDISGLTQGSYLRDIPPLETVLVRANEGPAPFDGKGIGESAHVPTAGAIANAIAAAVGVRITELPITAEKIYFALHGNQE